MNNFQRGFLSLIRAALTESFPELGEGFDYGTAYTVAEQQQIVPLVYYGAMKDPVFLHHPRSQAFFGRSCVYIGHSADQSDTIQRIFEAFEAVGVSYMPLKGTLLKPFYPSPEMRVMADADILIRMEEYDRAKKVMLDLGCTFLGESDHEYNWVTPTGLHIELHKRLIPSYNEDYYAYYGDGWRLAVPEEKGKFRFSMRPEDLLIYLFTHFAKHYRDQGAGMKYVIDFYIFRQHFPKLDSAYLARELENLQLYEFYVNIFHMLEVWFDGAEATELTDYLTDKIFFDGVFGRSELGAVSEALKLSKSTRSVRAKKKRQLFFPPYRVMKNRYPVLQKWVILLPIFWLVRLVDLAVNHRERYRVKMAQLEKMSDENISQYQRDLNYVGLDYKFGGDDPPTKKE
jgi:hypothetical protein